MQFNRNTYYDDKTYTEDEVEAHSVKNNIDPDMAGKLYWKPLVDNDEPFDKQLKWILQEEGMLDRNLTIKDISFLRGVRASRKDLEEDASRLIEALEKFGYIQLYIQDE